MGPGPCDTSSSSWQAPAHVAAMLQQQQQQKGDLIIRSGKLQKKVPEHMQMSLQFPLRLRWSLLPLVHTAAAAAGAV